MLNPSHQIMWAAIEAAEDAETPFGTALGMGEEVFATAVCYIDDIQSTDKHAEIKLIQKLHEQLRKKDLSGFSLYSTCQPFKLAVHKASESGIKTFFYGCSQSQVSRYFSRDQYQPDKDGRGLSNIDITGEVLEIECYDLLQRFARQEL